MKVDPNLDLPNEIDEESSTGSLLLAWGAVTAYTLLALCKKAWYGDIYAILAIVIVFVGVFLL